MDLNEARAIDVATSGGAMLPDTTPVAMAVRLLAEQDRDFCVVIGGGGRAVGIVLAADILDGLLPNTGPVSSRG